MDTENTDITENLENIEYDFTLADLFKAYFDCRRHKRCKSSALAFELNLEENLLKLYKEIKSGQYKIGRSICFVVVHPKPREVWAASFRDRIIHHLIYNFIGERFHKSFIRDTYSCIPKRGTLAAARRLLHFSRSATDNYTKKMFYLKADLSNFFVSIDKDILYKLICRKVPEPWLRVLIKQVIYHDHLANVLKKSSKRRFSLIPPRKSLFCCDRKCGLPIGNLTSQFFSNVYLDVLDKYVKYFLRCKYYIRYVDDFIIISNNAKRLNSYLKDISDHITEALHIKLNPRKKIVNKVENGMDFVGFYIRPHRIFLRASTVNHLMAVIFAWKRVYNPFGEKELHSFFRTVNSYLGMMVNIDTFLLRSAICVSVMSLFLSFDVSFRKIILL